MKLSVAASLMALVGPQLSMGQELIQLHGSGTTNPSKCYWHIMDLFEAQSKLPLHMTYRAVGSSTGQAEFVGDVSTSDNHFGSGDIPLSQTDYDKFTPGSILHLPVVVGAISFFHSLPTGDNPLNLNPCVLARIFSRKITDWNDPEIMDLNEGLKLPKNPFPITVAHRVEGSSSTASITQYLHEACSDEWPIESVGKEITWEADTKGCLGSGGVTDCIRSDEGTIGYIDSGHGHAEGLQEIELLNADGNYLSSKEAMANGGVVSAAENADLPTSLSGSFANVNLLNQAGEYTWPIVAMSYIYVRQDITFLPADSQALLKIFLTALYREEYIGICEEEFGFNRITGNLRDQALAAIEGLTTSAGAPSFLFENGIEKREGQQDYVISNNRAQWADIEQDKVVEMVTALQKQIETLQAENELMQLALLDISGGVDHIHDDQGKTINSAANPFNTEDQESQITAALALASISFVLWCLALIFVLVKYVLHVV